MLRPRSGHARPTVALLALLLAAWTAAVFLPALGNGFVWDDEQYVLENPRVRGGLTAENARWALTSFEAQNWHPLTWLSHMLDVQLFGLEPWGHHLTNVLLHAANAALLFALLAGLTGAPWRSLLAAALFAVHPLHVESVAWVAERKDVLSTLLGLAAMLAWLGAVRRPGRLRSLAAALLFAAGLAAKPMLVTLPLAMLLLDAWPLGRLRRSSWRRPVLEKLPLLALSAASAAVTLTAQLRGGAGSDYPLDARLTNAAVSYVRYLAKALVPAGLSPFYPHAGAALPLWQAGAALLLLAAASALVLWHARRRPWLAVGWFWFAGTLVPVIGLVQVGQQAMADRYTYLPLVGIFVAASWAAGEVAAAEPGRWKAVAAIAAFALLACSALTVRQVAFWRDPVTLFTRAITVTPGNWLAHYNLGYHYQRRGQVDLAAAHYREAVRARPDHAKSLNNLGALAADAGRAAEAVDWYRAALRAQPGLESALVNLGVGLGKLGRQADAEAAFLEALRSTPDSFEAREYLAELLLRQGRLGEAERQLVEVLRRHPDSTRARNWLGVAMARQGRLAEAAAEFRRVLEIDPADADARGNLQRALASPAR